MGDMGWWDSFCACGATLTGGTADTEEEAAENKRLEKKNIYYCSCGLFNTWEGYTLSESEAVRLVKEEGCCILQGG